MTLTHSSLVAEISEAIRQGASPMFLMGLAALGQRDMAGTHRAIEEAGEQVYRERERAAGTSELQDLEIMTRFRTNGRRR